MRDQSRRAGDQNWSESYINTGNTSYEALLAQRTATREAAFLLPHLRPGLRVLDVGCGPGSITLGLAEAVTPGEVVGIEMQPTQVEMARELATQRSVPNVRFEVGSIYELPFPDASFDVACALAVLFHLRDPHRALLELRRVLQPGGIVGLLDHDEGTRVLGPSVPLVEEAHALEIRVLAHHGGNGCFGRQQRRALLEAGFARSEGGTISFYAGSLEATRRYAALAVARWQGPLIAGIIKEQSWADDAKLNAMYAETLAWGDRPDAFLALAFCTALGWVAE